MDLLLSRYRNLTVLVLVIVGQLLLLAYQVKTNQDVRLIRIWAVTGITFVAEGIEVVRRNTIGFVEDYLVLLNVREKNQQLGSEMNKLKLENQYLRNELTTADRVRALALFQAKAPSQTVAARILGTGTGTNSSVIFVDRGSNAGVERGMAVITPDGIVGKVLNAYPTASQVMLITDPSFAAGVISQKNRIHGTLQGGQGYGKCIVDHVQNEEKVEVGDVFYTSGDDRIFPKGIPVGPVAVVRPGKTFKEIYLTPNSIQNGLEEVLIVLEGVHQQVPDAQKLASQEVHMQTPPPEDAKEGGEAATAKSESLLTDADRMREKYKKIGALQNHTYGEGAPGSKPPDFSIDPDAPKKPAPVPPQPTVAGAPPAPKPTVASVPPGTVKPAGVSGGTAASPALTNVGLPPKPAPPVIDPVTGMAVPPKPAVRKPRLDPVTGLPIPGSAAPPPTSPASQMPTNPVVSAVSPAPKPKIDPVTGRPIAPPNPVFAKKPAIDPVTGQPIVPRVPVSNQAGLPGAAKPLVAKPLTPAVTAATAPPKKVAAKSEGAPKLNNVDQPARAVPLSNDRVQ